MPARPPQRRDDGRHHRGIETVFRGQPGNGGKRHRLRQHNERAGEGGDGVGLERFAA